MYYREREREVERRWDVLQRERKGSGAEGGCTRERERKGKWSGGGMYYREREREVERRGDVL